MPGDVNADVVCFADCQFHTRAYHLIRNGESVSAEPKVFELLAILIEHRDRALSRAELFDLLWPDQEVGDSALTHLVYSLRRAVGDDSKAQTIIRTVHRRGYQFIAPIETPEQPTASDNSSPSNRRSVIIGALALVLAFGVAAMLWTGGNSDAPAPDEPPAVIEDAGPLRLGLLPLTRPDAPARQRFLESSFSEAVNVRLMDLPQMQVRSPALMRELVRQADSLQDLLSQAELDALLGGQITPSLAPGRADLTVELIQPTETGLAVTPLGTWTIPFPDSSEVFAEFLTLRDAIVQRLLDNLFPALVLDEDIGGTTDPEAFRLLQLAMESIRAFSCTAGSLEDLLHQALAIDPDFYLARIALAALWYNQHWACSQPPRYIDLALSELDQALNARPDQPIALFLRHLISVEQGRIEQTLEELARLLETRPPYPTLRFGRAYALTYAGFLEQASAELDAIVAADPLFMSVETGVTPNAYLYLGDYQRFEATMPTQDAPFFRFYRGLIELKQDRTESARELLEPAFAMNPADIFAPLTEAMLAAMRGERRTVLAIIGEIDRRTADNPRDGEMVFKQAQILAMAGEDQAAASQVLTAVEAGFFCLQCYVEDPWLSRLEDQPDYQRALTLARQRQLALAERLGLDPPPDPR